MASQRGKNAGLWQLEMVKTAITSDATTLTSDSVADTGAPVMVNGYSMANCLIVLEDMFADTTTVTPTFQVNATATSRDLANNSDFVTIAAGSAVAVTTDCDSNVLVGYSIDLVAAGVSTGLLRTSLATLAGGSHTCVATTIWLMTRPSQRMPDTDNITWAEIAS